MKKLSLFVAASFMGLSASAGLVTPQFFSENFVQMSDKGDSPTDGWITYGIGATPAGQMASLFGPEKPSYLFLGYGSQVFPISCTNWTPSQESDEWLVSPEFEVPADANDMVVRFTTASYVNNGAWGTGTCPYKIMVSTDGAEKENFSEAYAGSISVSANNGAMGTRDVYASISGFGGKKIRIAFVQNGQDLGPIGFSDIAIGNYFCNVENFTPVALTEGESFGLDMNVYIKTPVDCGGFNVVVYADGEQVGSEYFTKKLSGSVPQPQRVTLENLKVVGSESINYRVEITPNYEGAVATVLESTVGVPKTSYPNNILVEEITATGCQFCPIGIASMDYFADNYPGSETKGKFIGIAIHGNMNYADPMNEGVERYVTSAMALSNNSSMPSANFNRKTQGAFPYNLQYAKREASKTSYNKAVITGVKYPELSNPDDIYGSTVNVDFDVYNAYDAADLDLSAAIVLIENDVQGYESGYNQSNTFAGRTSDFVENYNSLLIPYMKEFVSGGSLAKSSIPYDEMVYQHVARGIWPDFYGTAIESVWEADKPSHFNLSFEVPDNLLIWENTEVIVMILDNATNAVVASDIFPFSKYVAGDDSSVEKISDDTRISRNGNILDVAAEDGATVNVYAADGSLLASKTVAGGTAQINASAFSGVVIVSVAGKSAKFVF